ncbi:Alpha/Beta hydrolase protein [Crassisporium funariophilum]|nr:Alpha/Beta hydrolase protein [Crassisporium funariophilum]
MIFSCHDDFTEHTRLACPQILDVDKTMNSVYFPAHVVVIFKRLFNVVSTLSISNQFIQHKQAQGNVDDHSRLAACVGQLQKPLLFSSKEPFERLKNVEWPWWNLRNNWDLVMLGAGRTETVHEIRKEEAARVALENSGMVLQSTIYLPKWASGNWSWPTLFSTVHLGTKVPASENEPPPSPPPKRSPKEDREVERPKQPPKEPPNFSEPNVKPTSPDIIHQLLINPALCEPLLAPRYPIVLCHGLYGFDSRGPSSFPSMRMHYWSNVLRVLRGKVGADVIVTSVPGTGSIPSRAAKLDEQLQLRARGRGLNFLAHSMGGLDCRHLISHIKSAEYAPLSLTSIATPHRGSPFMDWCAANIGIGKLRQQEKELAQALKRSSARDDVFHSEIAEEDRSFSNRSSFSSLDNASTSSSSSLNSNSKPKQESPSLPFSLSLTSLPSSFTTLLLSIVDSPAYANLTSHYLNTVFNPATPDDPRVKYWSVAGRMSAKSVSVWHPFWLPKMVLDGVEETERERLKKLWEQERGASGLGEDVPLWANEREWGNDGLVTVQSAKWGEFLGIMEGCDHWEMRGARGIEFGVDLPAIPSIGLGTVLPTNRARSDPTQVGHGDGWGFGDWTRFVGAWKKSNSEAESVVAATKADHKEGSIKLPSPSSSPALPRKDETQTEKRERERLADDDVVRSSTDTLSVVFDWLIERVPAPNQILGSGSPTTEVTKEKDGRGKEMELSAAAVAHSVAGSSSTSKTPGPGSVPASGSEMKRRMDGEKTRQQNELGSKEDLERFYVALTRKMYDEGL